MQLPFFYIKDYSTSQKELQLDEDTSRHIVQVMRMRIGEKINLTDGKGSLLSAEVVNDHKKHCEVRIIDSQFTPHDSRHISIAISLLKNTSRFEWFLEKATEIGISGIIPMICERTEKEKFRMERMQGIIVSAMLQSQQVWLPGLREPLDFESCIALSIAEQKFIAFCDETRERLNLSTLKSLNSSFILIGPEGDFTKEEVKLAMENNFTGISLGSTRLRSETAGLAAVILAQLG